MRESNSFENVNIDGGNPGTGKLRKPSIAQVGILYSIGIVLLLFVGFRVQRQFLYPGLLITEFILILLPPLLLLSIYKYDIPGVLRLNRVSAVNLLIILLIMIFVIPVVGVFNLVNLMAIKQIFGKVILPAVPQALNLQQLAINILIIGGSAGLCEEVMFRGVIQRGLERLGAARSILITAFLFGLFHLDFQRLLGTFMLGAVIGFIVYRTNSLYSGMFAHFANNSIAVVIGYISNKINSLAKSGNTGSADPNEYFATLANMPTAQLVAAVVMFALVVGACIAVLIGLMTAFVRTTADKAERAEDDGRSTEKAGITWFLPGFLLTALMYITEGLKLREIKTGLAEYLMKLMGVV